MKASESSKSRPPPPMQPAHGQQQQRRRPVFLPDDVISHILVRLPARSVGRFRCVAKSWHSVATSPSFLRSHISLIRAAADRHSNLRCMLTWDPDDWYPYPRLKTRLDLASAGGDGIALGTLAVRDAEEKLFDVLASCDGLLCLLIQSGSVCLRCIANPLTGERVNLPTTKYAHLLGFYFHPSSGEYRLLQLTTDIVSDTEVFAVGSQSSSWRRIPGRWPGLLLDFYSPVDIDGSLHWLEYAPDNSSMVEMPDAVVAFDKEAEVYNLLHLPLQEAHHCVCGNLVDFNGELAFWVATKGSTIDAWIFSKGLPKADDCGWTKRYSVDFTFDDRWLRDIAVLIGDGVLLLDLAGPPHCLVRCDLKSGGFVEKLLEYDEHSNLKNSLLYMESLASPLPALYSTQAPY